LCPDEPSLTTGTVAVLDTALPIEVDYIALARPLVAVRA
jgi:hypothetical protein